MAKIDRLNQNVVPFASNSTSTNRTVFGDTTQSDAIEDNINADYKLGWEVVAPGGKPPKQFFNGALYGVTGLLSYLYQQGIPEWNTNQDFYENSYAKSPIDGKLYRSKNGTSGTPNPGTTDPSTDTTNWELPYLDSDINSLTGKTTPIDADELVLSDSASSNILKKLTWANLKATLKSYFDTLYLALLPSVTGTATFTNVDQNINLTGIGSLSGLEVGDVIQVSGSTSNNTEFTVEDITDSDNIVVNYEHRGQTTSKALTDETSTAGVTVKLLCKWYNAPIGLGQGWCIPASVRNQGITYLNDTNREISVSVSTSSGTSSRQFLTIDTISYYLSVSTNAESGVYGQIPPESEYSSNRSLSSGLAWYEKR